MRAIRVRFAPSPTGFLHVGGARTALFNWLYARARSGVFVLRVEDTDRERLSEEMVRAILEGLDWLGITPDEGPFFQSGARERHLADAARLLDHGAAYRCFCDTDALRRARAEVEAAGGGYRYPRTCLTLSTEESDRRAARGVPFAVRVRVPERAIAWHDAVHGPTSFDGATVEDFIVVRSDGSPTYMLSVVSDDIAMDISDVIRGDDHLSNTPKQIVLYEALGVESPRFAHVPLILGPDKKRLSKRHGAVSVLDYRDRGYLSEAMVNFLALLGWNPGDDREKMSREELVDCFSLEGIGRSGAVFDLRKLDWLNGRYIDDLDVVRFADAVRPFVEAEGLWSDDLAQARRAWFLEVLALVQPRSRSLRDVPDHVRPFLAPSDDLDYDPRAARKHLKGDDLSDRLHALHGCLERLDSWEASAIESTLRRLAEERGLAAGKLIHPVRLAVTGRGESPGLFDVLVLLGRERSLARLARLVAAVDAGSVPGPAAP